MKTYLKAPFGEKEQAKGLGARYDMGLKSWYVPDGTDLIPFLKWVPGAEPPCRRVSARWFGARSSKFGFESSYFFFFFEAAISSATCSFRSLFSASIAASLSLSALAAFSFSAFSASAFSFARAAFFFSPSAIHFF